ncbi:MAG: hypothetical protein PUC35_07355 [Prevotellaceae bacterium]|nr:hypothetical protein [Prevotellaceae bacterium]
MCLPNAERRNTEAKPVEYVVPTLGGHMGPPLQSGGYGTSET